MPEYDDDEETPGEETPTQPAAELAAELIEGLSDLTAADLLFVSSKLAEHRYASLYYNNDRAAAYDAVTALLAKLAQ